jgi:hypothetical protein
MVELRGSELPITIIALRCCVYYFAYAPIALRYYAYYTYAPSVLAFRIQSIACCPYAVFLLRLGASLRRALLVVAYRDRCTP